MQAGAQGKAAGDEEEGEDAGMKALLKGRKGTKTQQDKQATAADFELLDYEADTGEPLKGRDTLPVTITVYMVRVSSSSYVSEEVTLLSVHLFNQTPSSQQPFLDATLFESFAAPTRLVCTFAGGADGDLRGLKQEIPDGCASSEPNEVPFERTEHIIDVRQTFSPSMKRHPANLTHQAAAKVASTLAQMLNERLKDPQTRQTGVRLGAFP